MRRIVRPPKDPSKRGADGGGCPECQGPPLLPSGTGWGHRDECPAVARARAAAEAEWDAHHDERVTDEMLVAWGYEGALIGAPEFRSMARELHEARDLLRVVNHVLWEHHRMGALEGWTSGSCPVCPEGIFERIHAALSEDP